MIYEGYVNGCEKVITNDLHEVLNRLNGEQTARINVWTNNGQLSHRFEVTMSLIKEDDTR